MELSETPTTSVQKLCHMCLTEFSKTGTEGKPCKTCKHQRLICVDCLLPEYEYDIGRPQERNICIHCKRYDGYHCDSGTRHYYNERMAQEAINLSFLIYNQSTFELFGNTYIVKKLPRKEDS